MKTIGYCFRRSFLHKVGSKSSLKKTMACDHTTVVAAKQEPAVGGETPSISDGVAGLELPSGDYALAMLVWSQQTAKAVQVLATPSGQNKKTIV